jgi:hypothetical protein
MLHAVYDEHFAFVHNSIIFHKMPYDLRWPHATLLPRDANACTYGASDIPIGQGNNSYIFSEPMIKY